MSEHKRTPIPPGTILKELYIGRTRHQHHGLCRSRGLHPQAHEPDRQWKS